MNEETRKTDLPEPASTDQEAARPAIAGKTSWMLFAATTLAIAAIFFSVFNYQFTRALQTDNAFAESTDRLDRQFNELDRNVSALRSGLMETQASVAALEQEQIRHADSLQSLFELQGRDNTAWALAEIENLLIMAIHALTLERDVATSLAAMEAANARLVNLADPALFSVRRQLTADMNALKSVNVVDITGLSLYLADFLDRTDDLQLRPTASVQVDTDITEVTTGGSTWQRLVSAVWQEFRSMFVISRTGSNARAVMLPDESWYLYQNLRLQLETARLAVIRRDTQTLRTSLEVIRSWLNEYFDSSDGGVINLVNTTERMSRLELDPVLPDVSSSLETLRAYNRDSNAASSTGSEDDGQ